MHTSKFTSSMRTTFYSHAAALLLSLGTLASMPTHATAATKTIDIVAMAFKDKDVTIKPGTKVTWTNRDEVPHTVTSRDKGGVLASPGLDTNESYSYTFTHPGDYPYYCTVHPFMVGVVHVRK